MNNTTVVDIHKKKGIRPNYDIYIGRKQTRSVELQEEFPKHSKWANFYYSDLEGYERHVRKDLWDDLEELRGKRLGCWCITTDKIYPIVCHGQILMKLLKELEDENETK